MKIERSKSKLRLSPSYAFISSGFNDGFKDSLFISTFFFFFSPAFSALILASSNDRDHESHDLLFFN